MEGQRLGGTVSNVTVAQGAPWSMVQPKMLTEQSVVAWTESLCERVSTWTFFTPLYVKQSVCVWGGDGGAQCLLVLILMVLGVYVSLLLLVMDNGAGSLGLFLISKMTLK